MSFRLCPPLARQEEKGAAPITAKPIYEHGEQMIPAGQHFNGNRTRSLGSFERFEAPTQRPGRAAMALTGRNTAAGSSFHGGI